MNAVSPTPRTSYVCSIATYFTYTTCQLYFVCSIVTYFTYTTCQLYFIVTYFMCLFSGVLAVEVRQSVQPSHGGKQYEALLLF